MKRRCGIVAAAGREALIGVRQERRRIAADLHDGVVQDLAGVAFGLAPLAQTAERRGDAEEAGVLRDAAARLRQGVRDLRTLLVEIHPPNLASTGLEAALGDLLSPLEARGIVTELDVAPDAPDGNDELAYRVAREALRNAQAHAQCSSVRVTVTRSADGTRMVVADDGRGFTALLEDVPQLAVKMLPIVAERASHTEHD